MAHGKSTVVKAISGVQTVRFKSELVRNITIKLGYANAKIYKGDSIEKVDESKKDEGDDEEVEEVVTNKQLGGFYTSRGSSHPDTFVDEKTGITYRLRRHVSFVDCPGHDILMATMLNGAAVMDAAMLLVAGNETCPQPQTSEHLAAVEIMRLENILILQNKVDLVKPDAALAQHEQIRKFVAGTVADSAPIIPISAVLKYNIDVVCEYIVHKIPVPTRDFLSVPRLIVIRSFDVNKPGQDVSDLQGGVAGGSILQGVLRVGDQIEVRPGIVSKSETADGAPTMRCSPIFSRISSLYAESNDLEFAVPGGLIGVGTRIDPTLTRADRLVGQVLGLKGQLPDVFSEIEISYYLLRRLLGVKTSDGGKQAKVQKLSKNEILMVNIGSTATGGKVIAVKGDLAKIGLTQPVCTEEGEKIALSRRVDKHWRLIGWGQIRKGTKIEIVSP